MTDEKAVAKIPEKKPIQLRSDQMTRTQSIFNNEQMNLLHQRTPKRFIKTKPGPGGTSLDFVSGSHIRNKLNSLFGYNWDFVVETTLKEAYEVAKFTKSCVVKGVLTGRVPVVKVSKIGDAESTELGWQTITKTQFGRSAVKFKRSSEEMVDFGNDMKAAAIDAMKKCASSLGIAADVYDKGEFIDLEVVDANTTTERDKNLEAKIAEAKGVISEQSNKVGGENEQHS